MAKYVKKTNNPKMGRPSRLTPKLQEKAVHAVKSGLSFEYASAICGIGYTTFRGWMKDGEADDNEGVDTKEREFFLKVTEAKAENAGLMMGVVTRAAIDDGDVGAATWVLKNHHRVGHKQEIEVKAEVKSEASIDLSAMTPEQLKALVADD